MSQVFFNTATNQRTEQKTKIFLKRNVCIASTVFHHSNQSINSVLLLPSRYILRSWLHPHMSPRPPYASSCKTAFPLACWSHHCRCGRHGGGRCTGSGEGWWSAGRLAEGCAAMRAGNWQGAGLLATSDVCPGGGMTPGL